MGNKQRLLKNLHTFNIAAKTLSFTETAQELHLTQGAVSHRIKLLEQELGFNLFIRGTRLLELTEEGHRFQTTLSKSLNAIFSEIDEIATTDLQGEISIATSPALASSWLLPRLPDFKSKYPRFNLNIFAQEKQEPFHQNNIEVAIFYDSSNFKDVYRRRLFGEKYLPVCTPQYAKKHKIFDTGLQSLQHINFIHALESNVWERWVSHMNLGVDIFQQFYCVSHRNMSITAALEGLGVAIIRYQYIKSYIESGELIIAYPEMRSDLSYDLICPLGTENRPKIRTFINWIESQL